MKSVEEIVKILTDAGFVNPAFTEDDPVGFEIFPPNKYDPYTIVSFKWMAAPSTDDGDDELTTRQFPLSGREMCKGYALALRAAGVQNLEIVLVRDSGGGIWEIHIPVQEKVASS